MALPTPERLAEINQIKQRVERLRRDPTNLPGSYLEKDVEHFDYLLIALERLQCPKPRGIDHSRDHVHALVDEGAQLRMRPTRTEMDTLQRRLDLETNLHLEAEERVRVVQRRVEALVTLAEELLAIHPTFAQGSNYLERLEAALRGEQCYTDKILDQLSWPKHDGGTGCVSWNL